MGHRLVATIDGKKQRFPLEDGEILLGSSPECAIRLSHSTVSRRHARVTVDGNHVMLEDLGSRNGIRLGSHTVPRIELTPDIEVRVGVVPVRLEAVDADDLDAAVVFDNGKLMSRDQVSAGDNTTFSTGPAERFVADVLPRMLARLADRPSVESTAQAVGEALFELLPCTEITVCRQSNDGEGVLYHAERTADTVSDPIVETITAGECDLSLELPSPAMATAIRPLLESSALILTLASVREPERKPRLSALTAPQLPDPPTVVPQLRKTYQDAARIARGEVSVLILGESGTGKEVLARYVHEASTRADGPFLGLDCAALPQDLLESELFGIERGVATGVDERPGKFELAKGGTLFLDEIGDMALDTQAKILRILQSGECYRLGARNARQIDVRIVAATNRDVREMLADGKFRNDLYHRIATWVVEVPPLRHRRSDIGNLAAHFLAREASKHGVKVAGISRAALTALENHRWPGNVRQLENEMARSVLFIEDGELLDTSRLSPELQSQDSTRRGDSLSEILDATERSEIVARLAENSNNIDDTAQSLGISRATLYRRMKALEIDSGG